MIMILCVLIKKQKNKCAEIFELKKKIKTLKRQEKISLSQCVSKQNIIPKWFRILSWYLKINDIPPVVMWVWDKNKKVNVCFTIEKKKKQFGILSSDKR